MTLLNLSSTSDLAFRAWYFPLGFYLSEAHPAKSFLFS
jgi:hypothetical protein